MPISGPANVAVRSQRAQCTSGAFRFLAIHMDEPARQRARELAKTPEFAQATLVLRSCPRDYGVTFHTVP
jgi:hypothetical protein